MGHHRNPLMLPARLILTFTLAVAFALVAVACGGGTDELVSQSTPTPVTEGEPAPTPTPTVEAEPDASATSEAETPTPGDEPTDAATPTPLPTPAPEPTAGPIEPPPSGDLDGIERYLLTAEDLPDLDLVEINDYEPGGAVSSGCIPFDELVLLEARGRQASFSGPGVGTVDSAATSHVSVENAQRVIDTARRIVEECRQIDVDGVLVDVRPLVVPPMPDGSTGFELGLGTDFLSVALFRADTVVVITNVAPSAAAGPIFRLQADRILSVIGGDGPSNPGDPGDIDLSPLALEPSAIGPGWEQDTLSTEITSDDEPGPCGVVSPPAITGFEAEYSGPNGEELLHLVGVGREQADAWVTSFEELAACQEGTDGFGFAGEMLDVAPPAGADRSVAAVLVLNEGDNTESLVFVVSRYGDFVIALGWFAPVGSVASAAERLVELSESTASRLPT